MQPDIQLTLEAQQLLTALGNIGGMIKKDPDIKQGLQAASKYLIAQGRQRLSSRMSNTGDFSKKFTYTLWRSKRGSLVGFKVPSFAPPKSREQWECMRPWVFDKGTKIRKTDKGYNRGVFKGSNF